MPISEELRLRLRAAKRRGLISRRPRRPPRMIRPAAIQRLYAAAIVEIVNRLEKLVVERILPALPSLSASAAQLRPDSARADAWTEEAERLIATLKLDFSRGRRQPEELAEGFADDIGAWNDKEWRKVLRSVVGVEIFQAEPWLVPELRAWAKENAALITSLEDNAIREVERWTFAGLRAGQRHEEIAAKIRDRLGASRSRAALIARDQTAKLNANITERRQRAVGVEQYVWRTSLDERVRGNPTGKYPNARPSHWAREGKTYKWSKPPVDGHPGQPINCRCTAEPDLSGLLAAASGEEE